MPIVNPDDPNAHEKYLEYLNTLKNSERLKYDAGKWSRPKLTLHRVEGEEDQNSAYEIRVVDSGEGLTVGRVILDPYGEPYTTQIDIIYAEDLSSLRALLEEAVSALDKPVVSMRNLI